MPISANVVDGKLDYNYTDSGQKEQLGSKLGYDQFLQLLCAEMQYQDPLEPTSNTDYVAQMATFSELEATLGMQDSLEQSLVSDETALASSLVGKNVLVADPTSPTGFSGGIVDYVMYQDGKVKLSVNDKLYDLDALDTVANDEYYEAVVATQTLKGMLNELPKLKDIDLSYKKAISQIRDVYEDLSDYQKGFVKEDDLNALKAYEKRIAELEKAEEEKAKAEEETEEETKAEETTEA